jgi:uncharacterized protein YbjT (DUF2867 family)
MLPVDLVLPMVAPRDLGEAAAHRLMSPTGDVGIRCVEGPDRYSSLNVARAFALALGRPVEVAVTPRDQWRDSFRELGFSEGAADSFVRMTEAVVDTGIDLPDEPIRGSTSLEAYVKTLVSR